MTGPVPGSTSDTPTPPVLVDVSRGAFVEARHRGCLVLVGPGGDVRIEAGDVATPVLARSALKPLQAVALLEHGFAGPDESVALSCASHDGELAHLSGVRTVLHAAGLTEDALRCPLALPSGEPAREEWLRAGGAPARVCHNCSGKHAAMLATCAAAGWPVESYLDRTHPLQVAVRARIESLTAVPVTGPEVDGCGAPAFAVSVTGLARAFGTIAAAGSASGSAPAVVARAMVAHPELVSASHGAHVELSRAVPGLVANEGAEGVLAAALPDGRAFAAKFADGTGRGRPALLAAVLRHWGYDGPAIRAWSAAPVLGGGAPVGAITASAQLLALLG